MKDRNSTGNLVLASIPPKEYRRLGSQLEPVTLKFGQVLYEPGGTIGHVYFPIDCLISLLTAVVGGKFRFWTLEGSRRRHARAIGL